MSLVTNPPDLPPVRGRYSFDVQLADHTWFHVGGAASVLFRPTDVEDLSEFLQKRSPDIPILILGAGSNVLIRDSGFKGIVIKLGRGFSQITVDQGCVEVGAGCLDRTVALTCAEHGVGGLDFLIGIPGTIGGAVKMNAGCYGQEIKDVLDWADIMDVNGAISRVTADELGMTYRHTTIPDQSIVVAARLKGRQEDPASIQDRLTALLQTRESSQPTRGRTGGSTFKNPADKKAWQLIDEAGCRGLMRGDAQVSEKHCNFLMNLGNASAADLEELGEEVRQRVLTKSGVQLEWEIIRLGE